MTAVPPLPSEAIEPLARLLGECGTGGDIDTALGQVGLDIPGPGTKWRRLAAVFDDAQRRDRTANRVLAFIKSYLAPVRFVGRIEEFESARLALNTILSFAGWEYGEDGEFREAKKAKTLSEAEKRTDTLRSKFQGRPIHPEALKYCRAELLQENYFHAVFEAAKGLAQRIREMSGVELDGAALVDKVFAVENPFLAFNSLRTETETSEHKGFAQLLKGCFAAVRNPMAHGPKLLWQGEDDAADYLTLISLLHRKLDAAVGTGLGGTG